METSISQIENKIYTIRGLQVMLDSDLAVMYQVETKVLNQAVKRNLDRFPNEFRFQLTNDEMNHLKSQIVTSKEAVGLIDYFKTQVLRFQFGTLKHTSKMLWK
jgi:hypothetical protein